MKREVAAEMRGIFAEYVRFEIGRRSVPPVHRDAHRWLFHFTIPPETLAASAFRFFRE